jgi:DNA repair protein RadA/Sms
MGEVGLAGEVRQVGHLGRRLTEAARLGFAQAIVPASAPKDIAKGIAGITLKRASTLNEALALAGLVGHPRQDD